MTVQSIVNTTVDIIDCPRPEARTVNFRGNLALLARKPSNVVSSTPAGCWSSSEDKSQKSSPFHVGEQCSDQDQAINGI